MANNYGLNILMESIRQSETSERQSDKLMFLFESTVDDRTASLVTGENYELDDEDSVEKDDAGYGIGYAEEKRLNKLIDKIPEDTSDETDLEDEDLDDVIESVLGNVY